MRMRPRGVVSKKDMGERRMFFRRSLWRSLEAYIPPKAREKEPHKMKRAWPIPRAPYTPRKAAMELRRRRWRGEGGVREGRRRRREQGRKEGARKEGGSKEGRREQGRKEGRREVERELGEED